MTHEQVIRRAARYYRAYMRGRPYKRTAEDIIDEHYPHDVDPVLWHRACAETVELADPTSKRPEAEPEKYCEHCGRGLTRGSESRRYFEEVRRFCGQACWADARRKSA